MIRESRRKEVIRQDGNMEAKGKIDKGVLKREKKLKIGVITGNKKHKEIKSRL